MQPSNLRWPSTPCARKRLREQQLPEGSTCLWHLPEGPSLHPSLPPGWQSRRASALRSHQSCPRHRLAAQGATVRPCHARTSLCTLASLLSYRNSQSASRMAEQQRPPERPEGSRFASQAAECFLCCRGASAEAAGHTRAGAAAEDELVCGRTVPRQVFHAHEQIKACVSLAPP